MKRLCYIIPLLVLAVIQLSCSDIPEIREDLVKELALNRTVSGTISREGEVDWYHYQAVEANNILQINCSSNTMRPDVDLLVTVYEENTSGTRRRLYADHAPEDSQLPADIQINLYIDRPKDIYIMVRDLLDDDYSDNPYYLTIDFADSTDGNGNFTEATTITIDNPESCQTDCIGEIGDIDCYHFSVSTAGIYAVDIEFSPFAGGTDVALSVDLYDSEGVLLESIDGVQRINYTMRPYLTSGDYYVLIDDYGRDDFDNASPYEICINSVTAEETNGNDTIASSSSMEYDSDTMTYSVSGSLDYLEDQDWYQIALDSIETTGFKVLNISFDDGEEDIDFTYQVNIISVENSEETTILTHSFVGGSSAYQSQVKAGSGTHYLMIEASEGHTISQSAPYTVSIEVLDVVDSAEEVQKIIDPGTNETVLGNNTIDTADQLQADVAITAKIGYRGDEDWYYIEIPDTSEPQVLEVFLDTNSQTSLVEYYISIMRDNVLKKAFDTNGEDGPTELKMSLLVPATQSGNPVNYYFRVCDYQGDDGDGLTPYRIWANLRAIPASLPADASITGSIAYYKEDEEREDEDAVTIELAHNSLTQKEYKANTTLLYFNEPNYAAQGLTTTTDATTGLTTISFPWIAGYIDFQGDQDWFQIDFSPLGIDSNAPVNSDWYYDIRIDLHVGGSGSPVEYIWKLYRDWDQDNELVDYQGDSNGFMASAGDDDVDIEAFDLTVPTGTDQEFWIGDAWAGKFYISISDFNYINSEHPDDDWDYDNAPYYFQLTLIYHPGESYP
ncbi:MAG: hypothetical protein ACMUJM_08155 [bacterium]